MGPRTRLNGPWRFRANETLTAMLLKPVHSQRFLCVLFFLRPGFIIIILSPEFIVKASSGPRYVVTVRDKIPRDKLKPGTRVSLDMTTLTIMRVLPREVDPLVFSMQAEDPGKISYNDVGGLNEQIRQMREVIELPLTNPELFKRVREFCIGRICICRTTRGKKRNACTSILSPVFLRAYVCCGSCVALYTSICCKGLLWMLGVVVGEVVAHEGGDMLCCVVGVGRFAGDDITHLSTSMDPLMTQELHERKMRSVCRCR